MDNIEISKRMAEFVEDRRKLINKLCGSGIWSDGRLMWYSGAVEELIHFMNRWVYEEMVNDGR